MIRSMTAFARKELQEEWGTMSWELRTVNHRFLETFLRMPEELRVLDGMVREKAAKYLRRGKLDATLRFQPAEGRDAQIKVNTERAKGLIKAARDIEFMMEHSAEFRATEILRMPGVLEEDSLDMEPIRAKAMALLEEALKELVESRGREGSHLKGLILQRCDGLQEQVGVARERMPLVIEHQRERLRGRLDELKADLEPTRLEQEIAIVAQKLDVDEEMDRLASHIQEVRRVLDQKEPVGRRLDFLMQELNREANTLGSKSADVDTTRCSVEMKVLIEQMREQIQNIE